MKKLQLQRILTMPHTLKIYLGFCGQAAERRAKGKHVKCRFIQTLGLVLMLSWLFGLSGCGQNGPLYLPDAPPKSQQTRK